MKLRILFLLIISFYFAESTARAQQTVEGTVYIDQNDNGEQDSGEEGLSDVAVSNGREVVLTDDDGAYSLDIDERDGHVFVIKPSGYELRTGDLNRPQFYYLHKPEGRETFRHTDRNRLFDLLKDYPNTLSLSAHTHIQQFHFFDEEEGWGRLEPHIHYNVGTTNGDWWSGEPDERNIPPTLMRDGTPNGYAMLNIDGNSFTIDYKAADYPENYQMSVWGPELVPQDSWHGAALYVNYFLGNEFTHVDYQVQGHDDSWRRMGRVETEDPYVTALRQKWDRSETLLEGKRPSNPVQSSHLWRAGIPNNLPLGEQTIQIRVTDLFGRTFTDEFTYEVVEPAQ